MRRPRWPVTSLAATALLVALLAYALFALTPLAAPAPTQPTLVALGSGLTRAPGTLPATANVTPARPPLRQATPLAATPGLAPYAPPELRPTLTPPPPTPVTPYPYPPYASPTPEPPTQPGRLLFSFGGLGIGESQFGLPYGVAVAPDGSVYVTYLQAQQVRQYTAQGRFLAQWQIAGPRPDQPLMPHDIEVAADGTLFVTTGQVHHLSAEGRLLDTWSNERLGHSLLNVALGPDTSVYASGDNHITRFSPRGMPLGGWGGTGRGPGEFASIPGLASAPNGTLYAADWANDRVQVFTPAGVYVGAWGPPTQDIQTPTALAVAPDGTVFVVEPRRHRVSRYAPTGERLEWWDGPAEGGAQWAPAGVAVAPDGKVYVTDTGNRRVQVYQAQLGAPVPTLAATLPPPPPTPTQTPTLMPGAVGVPEAIISQSRVTAGRGWILGAYFGNGYSRAALADTSDGGQTWRALPPPSAIVYHSDFADPRAVQHLRFANEQRGWAYGPGLFMTQDGGLTWTDLTGVAGIMALDEAAGTLWAVQQVCPRSMPPGQIPCRYTVVRATTAGGDWQPTAAQPPWPPHTHFAGWPEEPVRLTALSAQAAWVYYLDDETMRWQVMATRDGGATWQETTVPCQNAADLLADALADGQMWVLCLVRVGKPMRPGALYVSADGGQMWTQRAASVLPDVDAPAPLHLELAVADDQYAWLSLAERLFETHDGGVTWRPVIPGR